MSATSLNGRPQTLICRLVERFDDWLTLEPVWNRLLDASPDSTPWQSFEFLTRWWQHLGVQNSLRIHVVERAGEPVLIVPLQISSWKMFPGIPVRRLEPVSMIMDVNRPRLALGKFDADAYRCAFDSIWQTQRDWHLLRIDEKPWDDAEVALLRSYALERGCIFRQAFSHLVPWLDLRQGWSIFIKTRSQRMRKNLKAARRKLEISGPLSLRRYETPAEIATGFSVLLELHAKSWKAQNKVEHTKSSAFRNFYQSWVDHMASNNRARVYTLHCGDRAIAATIAFCDRSTYYSAQIVHDEQFAHGSPGTLLESMELEDLMSEQKFSRYDFLGSFITNKMRWTDTATNTSHVLIFRRCLVSFVVDLHFSFLKPYFRPVFLALWQKLTGREWRAER